MWKQIPLILAFGLLAACGGGGSTNGSDPSLPVTLNSPPQIVGVPPDIAQVGQLYQFTPSATDADGDTLTFSIDNRPDWATFSPSTGRLEGTPPSTANSAYASVLIRVSDGKSASELPAFSITVQGTTPPENTPPTISGTPATSLVAGNAYEFIPQVVDPDGQTLAFSISGKPAWAEFDTVTGRLWGTPAASEVGTSSGIVISVSDGVASASLPGFSIQVTGGTAPGPTNRPPTITGSPAGAVAVGQAYSFTPSASDPDGQALTFSITNKPSWATFSASTGRLSGTPAAANVGSTSNIVISVTDGAASASLPAFAISVVAANAGADHQWYAGDQRDGWPGVQLHADRVGSEWSGPDVLDHQQAVVGDLQRVHGPPEWHAGRSQCGQYLEYRHFSDGRRGECVASGFRDLSGRGQRGADHQWYAGDQRDGWPGVQLHADRVRSEWSGPDVLDHQQAVVGDLQRVHGPP